MRTELTLFLSLKLVIKQMSKIHYHVQNFAIHSARCFRIRPYYLHHYWLWYFSLVNNLQSVSITTAVVISTTDQWNKKIPVKIASHSGFLSGNDTFYRIDVVNYYSSLHQLLRRYCTWVRCSGSVCDDCRRGGQQCLTWYYNVLWQLDK